MRFSKVGPLCYFLRSIAIFFDLNVKWTIQRASHWLALISLNSRILYVLLAVLSVAANKRTMRLPGSFLAMAATVWFLSNLRLLIPAFLDVVAHMRLKNCITRFFIALSQRHMVKYIPHLGRNNFSGPWSLLTFHPRCARAEYSTTTSVLKNYFPGPVWYYIFPLISNRVPSSLLADMLSK